MRSVALDVHLDFCEVAIVEDGEVRSAGRIETKPEQIELFAASLGPDDRVALEVTGNAWEIARIIEPHVAQVLVVSPSDTGIRQARAKTDRLDARTLARLLAAGSLDGVWMPDRWTWVMRRRLSRRSQLVWARSRAQERDPRGADAPAGRPPAGHGPVRRERPRVARELELAAEERETVDARMRQIEFLEAEIAEVERLIAQAALESAEIKRLMSVPGVNVIVAASFLAAIGDIRRFESPRKLVGYLGLDPLVRQSGVGPATHGHISKQGSVRARHALVEACWTHGPPARPAARVLSAHPRAPRALRRDRRGRAQARVPVLVSAHPRTGLRLPAALADQEEAPASRDHRRRASATRRRPRASGAPTTRSAKPSASSPARPRSPTRAPCATGMPPRR